MRANYHRPLRGALAISSSVGLLSRAISGRLRLLLWPAEELLVEPAGCDSVQAYHPLFRGDGDPPYCDFGRGSTMNALKPGFRGRHPRGRCVLLNADSRWGGAGWSGPRYLNRLCTSVCPCGDSPASGDMASSGQDMLESRVFVSLRNTVREGHPWIPWGGPLFVGHRGGC
jgi:hypothetical protein